LFQPLIICGSLRSH